MRAVSAGIGPIRYTVTLLLQKQCLSHFLDNLLTDGGEVVSLTRRMRFTSAQEVSWYLFLLESESTPGP
jgi:hypothetical protein